MKLSVQPYFLQFIRPFELAHGTRTGTTLAIVQIEAEGTIAYGEASLPPYYPETSDSVRTWVLKQSDQVKALLTGNPFLQYRDIPFSAENPAGSAALQSAILHWYLNKNSESLVDYFPNSDDHQITPSSHTGVTLTLTKQDLDSLDEKLGLAANFSHLKLKLTGADDDLDFVRMVKNNSTQPFCVDLNLGCKDKESAITLIESLDRLNCLLVEQPLKARDHEGHLWLTKRSSLPIIADESIRLYSDLIQFHEAYSGVNVKIMKCGGLMQAQDMLQWNGLGPDYIKLLGCMSESSLSVYTASVLSDQCELADLDSPYLAKNDPFSGFEIRNGHIHLSDRPTLIHDL